MKHIVKPTFGFFSALVGALIAVAALHLSSWGKDTAPNITVETTPVNRDAKLGNSFAPVVKKVAPSVVNIYSTHIVHIRPMRNPLYNDPFFRQFFGDQFQNDERERTRKEQSLGSGVIISPDGYILTANHVVDGADEIKVAIDDGKKEYTAKVIGTDPPTDVAVLKIDAKNLPAITLGDSDQLEVGDIVLAIGNPFRVGQTVTMGIVSALGRSGLGFNGYEDFIQTDAAINPGNSGGALVDAEGRLVGINTAIISSSGGNQGIGFAVPINMARHAMERLISGGKVTRGYLGLKLQDINADLAEQFGLPDQSGALVDDVLLNTPAEKGGIKSGDVITAFNGKPISDSESLMLAVSECAPGTAATVKLLRDGQPQTIKVTLGELPDDAMESQSEQNNSDSDNNLTADALDGVTVADLDQQIREELKIPANINGAIVTDEDQDSNSAEAGLQRGDVIVEINRQPVSDADDAVKLCTKAKGDQILLKIWRRDGDLAGTRYLSVDNTKTDTK
ncbi:MAG: DegQ family serine endoprotease [Verrucomicrobiota bacterium]|jgi:serine protease Do